MEETKIKQLILEVISDVLSNVYYYPDEGESFDVSVLKVAINKTKEEYNFKESSL